MDEVIKTIRRYINNSDAILGAGVVFILALIVIPLPGVVLDLLIGISLLAGLLILLTALSSTSPADFSSFPTLLLITTIYRIAVNISTTRLILTKGASADSSMITAFGTFVVGGGSTTGLVVGIVIFIILTLVQIIVITKGATRVSEVAARFALDSLPGKQLAIDADQTAGYIDEKEARRRRRLLQKEMDFYGSMDGASKFVQGDVRLGLIITAVNIAGGMIIGMTLMNMSFSDALEVYTRFTIGDGLVSQIPALLISTATGIIVSRSAADESLPDELKKQLLGSPTTLYITGGLLVLAGLIPGFPTAALFILGGGLIFLAYRVDKAARELVEQQKQDEAQKKEESRPESYLEHLKSEPLEVEVGYNLIPLVDPKSGGTLLEQVSRLRRRFAMDLGLIVPPVRIRDNMNLEADEYAIRLHGTTIARARVEPDRLLAINTGRTTGPIEGAAEIREPTYNLPAFWITPDRKAEAESLGYDVVDPSTVIATHLSGMIQQNSQDIMGRQQIKSIIDTVREENPVVVDEVLNEKKVSLGTIQTVLQNLLKENVSIRNMSRIMEAIASGVDRAQGDPYLLTESVRQTLRRQIIAEYQDENRTIRCISVHPDIDRRLREGIHRDPEEGFIMALKPDFQQALQQALADEMAKANQQGYFPVFLASRAIRAGLFALLERLFPQRNFAVLAHEEITNETNIEVVSILNLRRSEESVA